MCHFYDLLVVRNFLAVYHRGNAVILLDNTDENQTDYILSLLITPELSNISHFYNVDQYVKMSEGLLHFKRRYFFL